MFIMLCKDIMFLVIAQIDNIDNNIDVVDIMRRISKTILIEICSN